MTDNKKILVVTKNREQFKLWCKEHGINYKFSKPFVYYDENEVMGMKFSSIIYYGYWYDRKDLDYLESIKAQVAFA
jgi:hypothetical protein